MPNLKKISQHLLQVDAALAYKNPIWALPALPLVIEKVENMVDYFSFDKTRWFTIQEVYVLEAFTDQ